MNNYNEISNLDWSEIDSIKLPTDTFCFITHSNLNNIIMISWNHEKHELFVLEVMNKECMNNDDVIIDVAKQKYLLLNPSEHDFHILLEMYFDIESKQLKFKEIKKSKFDNLVLKILYE
jgi:hypothetical protein